MNEYPIVNPATLHPINEFPMNVPCPQCKQIVITRVEFAAGALTYLLAVIMSLFGLICCAWIPCCVDACKAQCDLSLPMVCKWSIHATSTIQDAYHFCPNCRHCFGVYKRL